MRSHFPSFLTLIDLFGRPVTINYFGKDKFKSAFGGMLSLIFFGFLGWSLYVNCTDLLNRKNPTINNYETYQETTQAVTISPATIPFAVQIFAPEAMSDMPYIDESILTVKFVYGTIRIETDTHGNPRTVRNEVILASEMCTTSHFGSMADKFAKFPLNSLQCLAKEQPGIEAISLQGIESDNFYYYFTVVISECDNATSSIECAPEDVRRAYIDGGWFYQYHINTAVDLNNFNDPNIHYLDQYATMLSTQNYKEAYTRLSPVEITTDEGWITPSLEVKTYIKANRAQEALQFGSRLDKMLITSTFETSKVIYRCSRTYKKIQNVLAEVGGLANVAVAVILVLTTPFLRLKFRESLINELFDIQQEPLRKKTNRKKKNRKESPNVSGTPVIKEKDRDQDSYRDNSNPTIVLRSEANDDVRLNFSDAKSAQKPPFAFRRKLPLYPALTLPNKKFQRNETQRLELFNTETDPSTKLISSQRAAPIFRSKTLPISRNTRVNVSKLLKARHSSLKEESKESRSYSMDELKVNTLPQFENDRPQTERASIKGEISSKASESIKPPIASSISPQMPAKLFGKVMDKNDHNDHASFVFSEEAFSEGCLETQNNNKQEDINFTSQPDLLSKEEAEAEAEIEIEAKERKIDVTLEKTRHPNQTEKTLTRHSVRRDSRNPTNRISLSLWEYLTSFFYKSEAIKWKLEVLSEGSKKIDSRLDIVTILKKMREIDKLKAMIFDMDQALLFENLPKPELGFKKTGLGPERVLSSPYALLRRFTFKEQSEGSGSFYDLQSKLERKDKKSTIDKKFIDVFNEA